MNQEILNYEGFEEAVRVFFMENGGENVTVDIRTVLKNNGVQLRGLTVFDTGDKVTPTIYLDEFYQIYLQGTPLESVLSHMQTIYAKRKQSEDIDVEYFHQYNRVKDTLRIKIINYEKNKQLLETVPYIRFLDLAVICYSQIELCNIENGTILIHEEHLELWNIDKGRLFTDAVINSQKNAPELMLNMLHFVEEMQKELPEELQVDLALEEEYVEMHILTNCHKLNGASVIFYPGVLEQCAQDFQSDFYVLPSSIHECILIPVGEEEGEKLLDMVKDVNDEQVPEEEILSYHVYQYHGEQGILTDLVTMESIKVTEDSSIIEE